MSLVNCLSIHRELLKDFDTSEIEAGAAAYAKKGMGAQAAERKAIADKLADLAGERERVTKLALDTHNEKTVKGYEPFDTGSGWVLRKEVKLNETKPAEQVKPKSNEQSIAQKFVDENPDQTMKDDNGNTVLAKDYYEQYQRQIKEAENDSNAFAAAINCALGEG